MKKFRHIILFCFIVLGFLGHAQDVEFSQFFANRLYLNPAFAGSELVPLLSMNYRNQWPQNNRPFVTHSVSIDQYVDFMGGGVGLLVIQDNQGRGVIKTTSMSAMYSYAIDFSREFSVRAGIKASLIQRKLKWDALIFSDMIDPLYGVIYPSREVQPNSLSKSYWDFSTGFIASYRSYFLGLAIDHISEPDEAFKTEEDFTRLPRKYSMHLGANFTMGNKRGLLESDFSLSPNILFQQQQSFQQINYGLYLNKANWVLGGWFRQNLSFDFDAFIVLMGYYTERFRLGYSYDYVMSRLLKTNSGAHEISMGILLGRKRTSCNGEHLFRKRKRIRALKCPKF